MPDDRTHTIPVPHRADARDARPTLRVTVLEGPDRGTERVLESDRAVVGRAPAVDVRLTDPTVSSFHAELVASSDGVTVRDLGSRNGTRVGPARVRDATVPHGTELFFGSTRVRVDLASDFRPALSMATSFGGLLGASARMRELYAVLERLARTDLTVLLEGDTGVGKEIAARALHDASPRATRGPFVALDCTAIPPTLAESVLFGHERGAFTGATSRRAGVFESAEGGTLLLDEVGELPTELQPKLLRVLERREVVPIGAPRPVSVNVRIVAATWRDLRRLVNDGAFREDLYHRLAQARLHIPSLADRPDDVRPLVHHFLARLPLDVPAARAISDEALELLASRAFPGNVRELRYAVERVAMLADGAVITPADLAFERLMAAERVRPAPPEAARPSVAPADDGAPLEPFKAAKRTLIDEFERGYLARLLERAGTNVSRAAKLAGIERPSLRELLRRHGLRGED